MSFHSLLSKTKTTGRRKHQEIITSLWVFIFVFFSSSSSFHYLLSKTKTKNHKRKKKKKKKERKKRSNWTKLPRKSKEENNNNRQRPNQKEKKNNNNNKEEGIGIVQYLQTKPKRKKKRKRQRIGQAHVQVHMGVFIIYLSNSFHSVFFIFWRENILLGPGRKHLDLTYQFFSLLSPDQTPTKKVFILIFSSKFSFLFSFQSFRFIKFLIIE